MTTIGSGAECGLYQNLRLGSGNRISRIMWIMAEIQENEGTI
jgi:hypothetical protein